MQNVFLISRWLRRIDGIKETKLQSTADEDREKRHEIKEHKKAQKDREKEVGK